MHFKCLVMTNESTIDSLEKTLAPYQENNMGDCPEEYLEFEDETDSIKDIYKNIKRKFYFDEKYNKYIDSCNLSFAEMKDLDGKLETLFAKNFYTFEHWAEIEGYASKKDENGNIRYGYYYNPNSEWDYWNLMRADVMSVYDKSGNTLEFPCKISDTALSENDNQLLRYKFQRVWEQLREDALLENGEPEVTLEEYPNVEYFSSKEEYINCSTLGCLHRVYSFVSEEHGWIHEISKEELSEILFNPDFSNYYLSIVDCHV